MHRFLKTLVLTLATATLVTACSSVKPPSRGRGDVTDHYGVFFSQQHDQKLRKSTALLPESSVRDSFGLLKVTIPIRSAVAKTQYLEYQYSFFDSAGQQIEGPTGWIPITLEAGSPGTIRITSTNQSADEYRVVIREQR